MASSTGSPPPTLAPATVARVCRAALLPLPVALWSAALLAVLLEVLQGRYLVAALALPIAESEWSAGRGGARVLGAVIASRALLGVWADDGAYVALAAVFAPACALV